MNHRWLFFALLVPLLVVLGAAPAMAQTWTNRGFGERPDRRGVARRDRDRNQ